MAKGLTGRKLFQAAAVVETIGEQGLATLSRGLMMVTTRKRLHRTVLKLSVAAFTFASIGAAVAAPLFLNKTVMAKTEIGQLQPLARGPAIQLAKAAPGEAEDCVRVTKMIGPDGQEVPTFGMVCGGAH